MRGRKIIVFVMLSLAALLTGCGKKKIDVTENLQVSFEGYDGYGTARLENEYFWESEALDLADGTCSVDLTNYTMPTGAAFFGMVNGEAFTKGSYYYNGYEETDSLFNNCVTKNIEQYEYESSVAE